MTISIALRRALISALIGSLFSSLTTAGEVNYRPQAGDLIFQVSGSRQAEAVRLATGATYGHVGIVFMVGGKPQIIEAGGTSVHYTSIDGFIKRTGDQRYVVKRLRNANSALTAERIQAMQTMAEGFKGVAYDRAFNWSDTEMYCTELAWKVYKRTLNVELGALRTLGEFNLSHPKVKALLAERYGESIPVNEKVISPADLFSSRALETVYEGS